ncbi:MAG TPA: murein transglycosylase A, partial [Thermoanaerobaculia bacterium]
MKAYRAVLVVLAALFLIALGLWLFLRSKPPQEEAEAEDRLEMEPASFADLPGWTADRVSEALPVLLRSCRRISALPHDTSLGGAGFAGMAAAWRTACAAASGVPPGDPATARAFFETYFQPFAIRNNDDPTGLFTGYYEPLLRGSRKRGGRYTIPLYVRPPDLVTVDLGEFREDLKGRRIAGRVEDGSLVPLPDRTEIEKGAFAGRDLELVWVDNAIDAFFLQIQGSGRVRLAEGGEMRVGYAAENGHPYFAIGKDLIERGALQPEEVSMQSIRRWLEENPELADDVMARNASYIFFQELKGEGPLGAEGVALTPGRSLAVDRKFWPLGVPVWLDAEAPAAKEGEPDRKLQRLLIAQDTGG